jgi:hypothetical protein
MHGYHDKGHAAFDRMPPAQNFLPSQKVWEAILPA